MEYDISQKLLLDITKFGNPVVKVELSQLKSNYRNRLERSERNDKLIFLHNKSYLEAMNNTLKSKKTKDIN